MLDGVNAVGFDLDGTLYRATSEMDNCVRAQIAKKLLDKDSSLGDVEGARRFFNERYTELQSGTRILREAGYEDASVVMDGCLANADVIDFIKPNPGLQGVMKNLNNKYTTYLLTSSPEKLSLSKLEKIGLGNVFDYMFFSDSPLGLSKSDGTAFDYAIGRIDIVSRLHTYIGDRLKSDIIPANKRGMTSVAVWKNIPEANYSIDNIEEIGELLL